MKNDVRNILKYNRLYRYFGDWAPKQLHDAYEIVLRSMGHPSFTIETGKISVDDVCNTLWNEMSYNPLRFGKKSPFVFRGVNSLDQFCNTYDPSIKDMETVTLLSELRQKLKTFLALMYQYDPSFQQTGVSKESKMKIKMLEYSTDANTEYKILACLVACIHAICQQNVKDYDTKPSAYRAIMAEVCAEKHPTGERKINDVSLAKINSLKQQQRELLQQISDKNEEIAQTQIRKDTLSGYEIPMDTSRERALLKTQESALKSLDLRLQYIQNQLNMLTK